VRVRLRDWRQQPAINLSTLSVLGLGRLVVALGSEVVTVWDVLVAVTRAAAFMGVSC
jgi:hypothetical protein